MAIDTEIEDLVRRLVRLEDELERILEAWRTKFRYRLEELRQEVREAKMAEAAKPK